MTVLAAEAGAMPAFVPQTAVLLIAAAVIGYVFVRLRIVPIVGFLLAGVVIGPNALALVTEQGVIDAAAEIGVMLLLFTIGIEFSLQRLSRIRRLVLLGGGLQVAGAVALTAALLAAAGVALGPAIFTGFLVALSSTAIVLKLLGDRAETGSVTGQAALAFLVFQDLAVVVMVLVLPQLGAGEGQSFVQLLRALATAAAVIAVTLVVARRVMPKLLEAVARACSPEVFLLSVIAICVGTAALTALAGVSLSLGAFLAGLVVSESRHSTHALGEVLPLQILFSATFFLSVGMLLDVGFVVSRPGLVVAAVGLILLVKLVTTAAGALAVGASGHGRIAGAAVGAGRGVLVRAGARRSQRRPLASRPGRRRGASLHRRDGAADGGYAGTGCAGARVAHVGWRPCSPPGHGAGNVAERNRDPTPWACAGVGLG